MAWIRVKRLLVSCLLFAAGLILGVFLFIPWDMVWSKALDTAREKMPSLQLSWTDVQNAGPLSFTISGLRVKAGPLPEPLTLNSLRVELGLTPMVTIRMDTGPILTVEAYQAKTVRLQGGLSLDGLLHMEDLSGTVLLNGDVAFPEWGQPPATGRLDITSPGLKAPQGVQAADLAATVELADNILTVRSFKAAEPIPVEAAGSININWGSIKSSSYEFSGSIELGGQSRPFKKSGNLNQIPGL